MQLSNEDIERIADVVVKKLTRDITFSLVAQHRGRTRTRRFVLKSWINKRHMYVVHQKCDEHGKPFNIKL